MLVLPQSTVGVVDEGSARRPSPSRNHGKGLSARTAFRRYQKLPVNRRAPAHTAARCEERARTQATVSAALSARIGATSVSFVPTARPAARPAIATAGRD